jgi:conjugative relaxase-like TrwC/TraI family protein
MRVMSAGDGCEYLLKSVAAGDGDRDLATPLTRYYLEAGCPPGRWAGTGLGSLGPGLIRPGDTVTEAQLRLLIGEGLHPVAGAPLGRRRPRYATAAQRAARRAAESGPATPQDELAAAARRIYAEERRRATRRAVAGFDYTFSVPKSVSVLWGVADAGTQALIAAAHHAAVADVLDFMEREVAATRAGHTGPGGAAVAQVPVTGVLAAAFDHWDSRAGDPQLHTHVVIANKAMAVFDGRWRSLDSRPMHAATVAVSEMYNAVLADHLTRVLKVDWEARQRGRNRNPAWEIQGVTQPLVEEFSSRVFDIDAETDRLIADHTARHHRRPSKQTIIRLRQQAALTTRPPKQTRSLAELTATWRQRAGRLLVADATGWATRLLDSAKRRPPLLRADDVPLDTVEQIGRAVVAAVSEKRAVWRRWNLHAEATRQTMGWRFATPQDRETTTAMITDAAEAASLRLTPPEIAVPAEFQRPDGSSVLRPRHITLHTSQNLLDAETRLLDRSRNTTGPRLAPHTIAAVTAAADAAGRTLGEDQADAIAHVAASGRLLDVLVGPAGAGKTTTLGKLKEVWEAEHGAGSVVGLAPSATAAAVLGEELRIQTENTAKWLAEHDHQRAMFHTGQLVIIDEATLAGTFTLDQITGLAEQVGAKTLLVGDWAQLQSVDAGGAFHMLVADRGDAPELTDIHRFREDWEKIASLGLRHANPNALDAYQAHDRISQGDQDAMTEAAYQAWKTDLAAGKTSLLISDNRDTVRELNQRARFERVNTGQTDPHPEATLNDGTRCSKGDLVITRHNNRHLLAGTTGWVRNGDRWTVRKIHPDGAITIRRAGHNRGATVTLPANYAAEHLDLG